MNFQKSDLHETVGAWRQFLKTQDWQSLIINVIPAHSGCGLVYELPNFLSRNNECFAIADMRNIAFAEPHYHPDNNFEVYFVLAGTATIVVGTTQHHVTKNDVIIIPPLKGHFTIPNNEFVLGVVNTPPFSPENYIKLTASNSSVGFDYQQFCKLIDKLTIAQL